jgi:hypothetical protein
MLAEIFMNKLQMAVRLVATDKSTTTTSTNTDPRFVPIAKPKD